MQARTKSSVFRFLKGAAAAAAAAVIAYAAGFVESLGLDAGLTAFLVGVILGLEKYVRWIE